MQLLTCSADLPIVAENQEQPLHSSYSVLLKGIGRKMHNTVISMLCLPLHNSHASCDDKDMHMMLAE